MPRNPPKAWPALVYVREKIGHPPWCPWARSSVASLAFSVLGFSRSSSESPTRQNPEMPDPLPDGDAHPSPPFRLGLNAFSAVSQDVAFGVQVGQREARSQKARGERRSEFLAAD
jgi:hypothetical protein